MAAESKTLALDIARIALRTDHRYDTDLLNEVFAYCWEQLCWRRTDAELVALRESLRLDDEAAA